ncbi:MAG: RsmF rRNA methyltransferase first C-terminal domain-containing protein [Lachnospiraceae bacterium]|nr:RsmF rRNA methyltransferase first C-terminal domain-containing protein [Lachnospiraceae bacterium]
MKALLGDEYDAFDSAYESERYFGLRVNPLKWKEDAGRLPFTLEPVDWAKEGYYYREDEHPGRHPLHEAGAYYIQEPSAMSAVSVLDPKPGDRVLDLCAAPGGKSTQIAGRLMGSGLLVSNEIISKRALILSENVERMGVRNCVVLNESPDSLSGRFNGFFDKILVDAPCSGEGMFRKEESALTEWSPENVIKCAERQAGILDEAASMLRADGYMAYSTCTFNRSENEDNVDAFLERHPEFERARADMRLFPHTHKGEGHFVALLHKKGEDPTSRSTKAETPASKQTDRIKAGLKEMFAELGIRTETADSLFDNSRIEVFGENIYLTPSEFPNLKGFKVMRPGLHVATDKKNRLEPAHSLAMAMTKEDVTEDVDLSKEEAEKYLKGETLQADAKLSGWKIAFFENCSTGLVKVSNGTAKNHYPKGLRK